MMLPTRDLSRLDCGFRVALAGPVCLSITSLHFHVRSIVYEDNKMPLIANFDAPIASCLFERASC